MIDDGMPDDEVIDGLIYVRRDADGVSVSASWVNGYGERIELVEDTLRRRIATRFGAPDESVFYNADFDERFAIRQSEASVGVLSGAAKNTDALDRMLDLPRGVALHADREIVTLTISPVAEPETVDTAVDILRTLAFYPLRWLQPFADAPGAELVPSRGPAWNQREPAFVRARRRGLELVATVGQYTEITTPNVGGWDYFCISTVEGEIKIGEKDDVPEGAIDAEVSLLARGVGSTTFGVAAGEREAYATLHGDVSAERADAAFDFVATLALPRRSAYR